MLRTTKLSFLTSLFLMQGRRNVFYQVKTDPLEIDPLAPSLPPPPSNQPTYLPMMFIIPTLMLLKNPTHRQGFQKF